jgi:hypothetical protein
VTIDEAWKEVEDNLPKTTQMSGSVTLSRFWTTERKYSFRASVSLTDDVTPHFGVMRNSVEYQAATAVDALLGLVPRLQKVPIDKLIPLYGSDDGRLFRVTRWWSRASGYIKAL